jgi:hypothetical protein
VTTAAALAATSEPLPDLSKNCREMTNAERQTFRRKGR